MTGEYKILPSNITHFWVISFWVLVDRLTLDIVIVSLSLLLLLLLEVEM